MALCISPLSIRSWTALVPSPCCYTISPPTGRKSTAVTVRARGTTRLRGRFYASGSLFRLENSRVPPADAATRYFHGGVVNLRHVSKEGSKLRHFVFTIPHVCSEFIFNSNELRAFNS